MSLSYTFTPGTVFNGSADEFVTTAKLNALVASSSISASGTLDTAQISANAVTPAKADAGGAWFWGTDAGTANAHLVTGIHGQTLTALTNGQTVAYKANATNTGAVTIAIDALSAKAIKKQLDQALVAGDIRAGQVVQLRYVAATDVFQLVSPVGQPEQSYAVAGGSANALTAAPAVTWTEYRTGRSIFVTASATNTGAATLTVSGLGTSPAIRKVGTAGLEALLGGEIVSGGTYEFVYDGTYMVLLNPTVTRFTYTSSVLGTSVATVIDQNHGLGAVPGKVFAYLYCETGETIGTITYVTGDLIPLWMVLGSADMTMAFSVRATATKIQVYQFQTALLLSKSGAAGTDGITEGNWKVKVVCEI